MFIETTFHDMNDFKYSLFYNEKTECNVFKI